MNRQAALRQFGVTAAVIAGSLVIAGALIALSGADALVGIQGFIAGISSSPYRIGELFVGAVPTAIVALTLIPALRAGLFSVGAEGQIAMGALAATATTLWLGDGYPSVVYWVVGALSGSIAGAAFAFLPALLTSRWKVNEILSTLLLNYIAAGILAFSLRTWLASGENTATPQSADLPEASAMPLLVPQTRAHFGIILIVVIAVLFILWRRSAASTRVDVFAERPRFAMRLGVSRTRTIYSTMLVSGAGAGLVGWIQLVSLNDRLFTSITGGVGFSGIAVALLGQLLPVGIVVSALFFSALSVGAAGIQSATGTVPASIADVVKSVILLGIACAMAITGRRLPTATAVAPVPATEVSADADTEVTP